jgi:GT2 family glycosyltransferase
VTSPALAHVSVADVSSSSAGQGLRSRPTVSVVIPCFNHHASILHAVRSVLAQTLQADEILLIDDASEPPLADILGELPASVRLVRLVHNSGAAAARNHGVALATGDMVAFLDSDDEWLPTKLEQQVAWMAQQGARIAASAFWYHKIIDGRLRDARVRFPRPALRQGDMALGCFLSPGSTLMVERAVFDEVGSVDVTLRRLEDWDWLLRCLSCGITIEVMPEPLSIVHNGGWPSPQAVCRSTAQMWRRHAIPLARDGIANLPKFASALMLERAIAWHYAGHPLRAALVGGVAVSLWPRRAGCLIKGAVRRVARPRAIPSMNEDILFVVLEPRATAAAQAAAAQLLAADPSRRITVIPPDDLNRLSAVLPLEPPRILHLWGAGTGQVVSELLLRLRKVPRRVWSVVDDENSTSLVGHGLMLTLASPFIDCWIVPSLATARSLGGKRVTVGNLVVIDPAEPPAMGLARLQAVYNEPYDTCEPRKRPS